jgi:hypothetical protein
MEVKDDLYHVLVKIRKNEHRMFYKVPIKKRTVEYSLAQLPPEMWAATVLSYLMRKEVPDTDIREQEPGVGKVIASCGHEIRKVMWEVACKIDGGVEYSVVCPECYSSYYKDGPHCLKRKTKRITIPPRGAATMKVNHAD